MIFILIKFNMGYSRLILLLFVFSATSRIAAPAKKVPTSSYVSSSSSSFSSSTYLSSSSPRKGTKAKTKPTITTATTTTTSVKTSTTFKDIQTNSPQKHKPKNVTNAMYGCVVRVVEWSCYNNSRCQRDDKNRP